MSKLALKTSGKLSKLALKTSVIAPVIYGEYFGEYFGGWYGDQKKAHFPQRKTPFPLNPTLPRPNIVYVVYIVYTVYMVFIVTIVGRGQVGIKGNGVFLCGNGPFF